MLCNPKPAAGTSDSGLSGSLKGRTAAASSAVKVQGKLQPPDLTMSMGTGCRRLAQLAGASRRRPRAALALSVPPCMHVMVESPAAPLAPTPETLGPCWPPLQEAGSGLVLPCLAHT